jgi:hypothetical protein
MSKGISRIDAAKAPTPDWMQNIRSFDALEIHPCAIVGHDSMGGDIVEQCEPEDAHFWTVFGHFAQVASMTSGTSPVKPKRSHSTTA